MGGFPFVLSPGICVRAVERFIRCVQPFLSSLSDFIYVYIYKAGTESSLLDGVYSSSAAFLFVYKHLYLLNLNTSGAR